MRADKNIHERAAQAAVALTGADVYCFAEGWQAGRVAGKWFMLLGFRNETSVVILKAHPEDVQVLLQAYAEIGPGYHMNKKHWYAVQEGANITDELLASLITESYVTVVEKLPKSLRPVGWQCALPKD